ncbi:hypothetical protein [Limnohabitans sp.]|uniref:hypothetical protein n=1 Tax=Limnohabitans sp. TaxID=1907725 RepID=UPI00286F7EEB|nr:hypothetical protein [Limnohabitans sp.]
MTQAERISAEIEKLEKIFPEQRLLTPAQVAPLIALSVETLANQRGRGFHLIPSVKMGGKVGFYIADVAAFIVCGSVCPEQVQKVEASRPQREKPAKAGGLTRGEWVLAMRETLDLNAELINQVEAAILRRLD